MSFGLTNASITFQAYINQALTEKLDVFCIVYLDDILIYTQDIDTKHVETVKWVLDKLKQHGLFVNLQKYRFSTDEMHFLRYVIASSRVSIKKDRIQSVRNWSKLKSVRDIQVFVGFANFYRRFIRGFSKIAAPLTELTKINVQERSSSDRVVSNAQQNTRVAFERTKPNGKNSQSSFVLTSETKKAFEKLKMAFTIAPILRHFNPELSIRIKTDASGYIIDDILSQLHDEL